MLVDEQEEPPRGEDDTEVCNVPEPDQRVYDYSDEFVRIKTPYGLEIELHSNTLQVTDLCDLALQMKTKFMDSNGNTKKPMGVG